MTVFLKEEVGNAWQMVTSLKKAAPRIERYISTGSNQKVLVYESKP